MAARARTNAGAPDRGSRWAGVWPINRDAPARYLSKAEGGVSHFNYLRDNTLLTWMHTRLFLGFLLRLPLLILRRLFA